MSQADALVWVIDSADRDRWNDSRDNFERLYKLKNSTTMPILFLANKQDRPNSALSAEIVAHHNLAALPNPWRIFRTENASGENLYEAFDWLLAQLEDQGFKITPPAERIMTAACEIQQ